MSELRKPRPIRRRDFLGSAACWTCGGALTLAAVGMLRMPFPAVVARDSALVRAGLPDDFPEGEVRWIAAARAFVVRDAEGVFAISGICTHLGCVVNRAPDGFECPCHGSRFGGQGELTKGPAPSGLPWLEVGLDSSGELVVNSEKSVEVGTRLKI